jgi:hypothetical protein
MDSAQFTHTPYGLTFGETVLACATGIVAAVALFAISYAVTRWAHGWRKKFWTTRGE